jgi:hypothetical protein
MEILFIDPWIKAYKWKECSLPYLRIRIAYEENIKEYSAASINN